MSGPIAVTGASGFVGRYVVRWLAGQGYPMRALSRSALTFEAPGIECHRLPEASRDEDLRGALRGTSAVVHLAARAHVMDDRAADPVAAYRAVNVDLTRGMLEAAADAGCGTFVLASSVKAVGERTTVPWNEETKPHPEDPYGQSKLEAETLVHSEGSRLGIRTIVLRFPLIYGPGMRANMLRLFHAVDRGLPLPVGAIHNRRSLLFVGNAAVAIERALATGKAGSGTFFVSDGQDASTPDLIRAIAHALGRPARFLPIPEALLRLAGRFGDAIAPVITIPFASSAVGRLLDSLQVDIGHARADLGYSPRFTLDQGLAATAHWYRGRTRQELLQASAGESS